MYYSNADIRLEEMPVPEIGDDEILVRVHASGICGSDLMEWYRLPKAPLVLGHEIAGEVVEVGKNVSKFTVGDRVVATHHVPCNTCHHCMRGNHSSCQTLRSTCFDPGGFSEYIRIPAINVDRGVLKLPDHVTYEEASFVEPLGCVLRGQRLAGFQMTDCVLVMGSGMTGLLHIQLAKAQGAGKIIATDLSDYKLEAAKSLGADYSIHADSDIASQIRDINEGRFCDFVVVCVGAKSAIHQAFDLVEPGGTILFFAPSGPDMKLEIPFNDFWWSGVKTLSSYAASPSDLAIALELIRSERVNVSVMVTHRLPLADTGKGFQMVEEGGDSIKIIVEPHK